MDGVVSRPDPFTPNPSSLARAPLSTRKFVGFATYNTKSIPLNQAESESTGSVGVVAAMDGVRSRSMSATSSRPSYVFRSAPPAGRCAVSYTHLRAHETRHDLVCRLLLE